MARRLWGCYSVADHLEPRAFVADLLLYDRLVVPVPAPDDLARWERWDPERQKRLLDILGGFAEHVEWGHSLRDQFASEWSPSDAALEIDESAYAATRRIITGQLQKKAAAAGDVRGVTVYAESDRFDREWQFERALPFVRRRQVVEPGALREAADALPPERQQLAKVLVTRLVVPDDGPSDEEVLKRTVDLVSRQDVAGQRAEFQELLASLDTQGLKAETIAGEVEDMLKGLNASVRQHTKAQRARVAVQFVTTAEGAAALLAPPVALATGPTAAAGEAIIKRRWAAGSGCAWRAESGAPRPARTRGTRLRRTAARRTRTGRGPRRA
jgi:hypothetical protein